MKEIEIKSKVHGTHIVKVDDEDYEELSKYNWYITKGQNTFYAGRNTYYKEDKNRKTILMHRCILNLGYGRDVIVDHIDHNGINNQKSNLRTCTNNQNCRNRITNTKSKSHSVYKGVYWHARDLRWVSQIKIDRNSNQKFLGYFKSEAEAAYAYDLAARNFFGEFANVNFETNEYYLEAKRLETI